MGGDGVWIGVAEDRHALHNTSVPFPVILNASDYQETVVVELL